MNTSDLKIDLISRITQLKDAGVIEEIQKMLDFELDQNEYILSESQKERIAEAREEYRNMNYLPEDKANQDIEDQLLLQ
ncbi:MAG: hypothetical protein LBE92_05700 [Chryseobacterium sp.]|jgi:ABC-type multidrug transport system fused ATPase/permease subunit|uniref:hypothetical protein n=1 Tax=Chryseobacterium sp. TaxID=1871047 RepID=UPI0028239F06|nr:hypothetical protein [Chryseobacterium sp.]MDR2235597.1 hypothetical protein [Chryseobacterium sp.]